MTEKAGSDLHLLYGVSRKTREQMRLAGLTTLAQVAALSPKALQQIKGIGPVTAPAIQANARAWLERRPIWRCSLPEDFRLPGWMFDLETLDLGGCVVPWSLGWCDSEGQTSIVLVAPVQSITRVTLLDGQAITLAPDGDTAWSVFAEAVSFPGEAIFHWTGYDAAILDSTAPSEVKAVLGLRMVDLHRIVRTTISLPLRSTSIKPVSVYLGFEWPGYQDWFAAYLDYRHWLTSGDLRALTRACMYQRADVQSMAWVWRWLVAHADDGSLSWPDADHP